MTLRDAKEWLYTIARSKRRRVAAALLLLSAAGLGWYVGQVGPLSQYPYASLVLLAITPLFLVIVGWLSLRPEKTQPGQIGIVLAIDYETEEEAQLMANDFVREVDRRLRQSVSIYRFQIIVPSRVFVPLAHDLDSAERLRRLCRAHFVLLADIRTRMLDGNSTRALRLDGIVCHTHVSPEVSAALAQEMRQVLPLQHRVACNNDLDGFEVTSGFIACAAKYVVAVAAMLSQDFKYATSLLEGLRDDAALLDAKNQLPVVVRLRELVPLRLGDSYLARSRQLHGLWRSTTEADIMREAELAIDQFNVLRPNDPSYNIFKAVCSFVLRRDVASARNNLESVRKQHKEDPTCLYSLAFLDAIEGKMDEAYHHYKQAVALDAANPATAFEVEEFIEWYLSVDSTKAQLHYCLGFLNFRRKGDLVQAKKDLQAFIASDKSVVFPTQRLIAAKWLSDIDARLQLKLNSVTG